MRRSEAWDKQEKEMDDNISNLKDLPPRAREFLLQALDIYLEHSDTCHYIKVLVSEEKIKKIECVNCGWKYNKVWWRFW